MNRTLWLTVVFLFALCTSGFPVDSMSGKTSGGRLTPIKPVKNRIVLPDSKDSQTSPVVTVTVSVVSADIRSNGYTVQIRNDSSTASGLLTVQISKGTADKAFCASGGGSSVQSLAAGASTDLDFEQPAGWNTGYTVFTVDVYGQVGGKNVTVGHRSFSIPPL